MTELLDREMQSVLINGVIHAASTAYAAMAQDAGMPHVLMRPAITLDGNRWCALYGEDLQSGVAGFGESPYAAMRDFDRAWCENLSAPTAK
jgi:hypothetical protein